MTSPPYPYAPNAHGRSRGDLDEDDDAYLVPSDWEDEGDDDDWGSGATARRAKERLAKLSQVRGFQPPS